MSHSVTQHPPAAAKKLARQAYTPVAVSGRARLTPIASLLLAVCAGGAWGQQAAPGSTQTSGTLPEIVVTGSRFAEPYDAGTAPGTTVITADDIAKSGALTVYDALSRLGGVQTRSNLAGTPDDSVDIRGFGVTSDNNTLVLIDGVRVSENEQQTARLSSIPLSSIARIEILRGSGAVLYGSGATGGVINVITKAAVPGSKSLDVTALAGSYGTNEYRANGGIASGPLKWLGGAALAVDFGADNLSTDNYRRNNALNQEIYSGRVRAVGQQGELGLRVATERTYSQLPGALSSTLYQADPRQANPTNATDWVDTDANRYSLYGNYHWQWVELAGDAYHRDKVDRFYNNFGGGSTQFTRSGSAVDGISPRVRITAPIFGLANQLVVGFDESRWNYRNSQAGLFTVGVAASEADLGTAALSSDETGTQHNSATYFKDDLRIGDLKLTAGARRETLRQSTMNALFGLPLTTFDHKLHAEEFGAAWLITPSWTINGHVGNSYRIGNIDDNRFRFPTPGFLLPQTSKDVDGGLAYTSKPVDLDLHLYQSRIDNEIMFVPGAISPPFGANINLSPTERQGVELTAKWRPLNAVDVIGFYTHVRARFRSGSFGGADLTGKEVPIVPRDRANLSVNWRITPVDSVNASVQYVGSQIFDNDQANTFGMRIPSYSLIDAKYTRRIGNVDLSLIGTNLGNTGYYSYGVTGAGGAYNVYPERRRGVFVSATAHF